MNSSSVIKNKKCLVFGADGYIGRHLVDLLLKSLNSVTAFGLASKVQAEGLDYKVADISERASLDEIDWNVDAVFMFAGLTGTKVGFQMKEQFVKVNEIGLLNILESIRYSGYHPRLIFPSTRLVYRGSDMALLEGSTYEPKTIYALNKLACENMLHMYSNIFGIDYTIYRICVPYGNLIGTQYSFGTVGTFLKQAEADRVIRLFGDGSLRRTFTHVQDLCYQILLSCLVESTRNQTFNTLGEELSLKEVASAIAETIGAKLEFTPFPDHDLRIESGHTVFDASKLQSLFDLRLKYKFSNWLESISLDKTLNNQTGNL